VSGSRGWWPTKSTNTGAVDRGETFRLRSYWVTSSGQPTVCDEFGLGSNDSASQNTHTRTRHRHVTTQSAHSLSDSLGRRERRRGGPRPRACQPRTVGLYTRLSAVDVAAKELGPPALACVRGGPICLRRREEGRSGGAMVMGAGEGRTEIRMPVGGRRLRSSASRMRSCALACQPSQLLARHAVAVDARPPCSPSCGSDIACRSVRFSTVSGRGERSVLARALHAFQSPHRRPKGAWRGRVQQGGSGTRGCGVLQERSETRGPRSNGGRTKSVRQRTDAPAI